MTSNSTLQVTASRSVTFDEDGFFAVLREHGATEGYEGLIQSGWQMRPIKIYSVVGEIEQLKTIVLDLLPGYRLIAGSIQKVWEDDF